MTDQKPVSPLAQAFGVDDQALEDAFKLQAVVDELTKTAQDLVRQTLIPSVPLEKRRPQAGKGL